MTIRLLGTFLALLLLLSGCTRTPGGIAPSNIPLEQGGYSIIGPVSASDCKINLLGLIPVSSGNSLSGALKKAKRQRGAQALIEIKVDFSVKYFILWSQACTEVRAIAVTIN